MSEDNDPALTMLQKVDAIFAEGTLGDVSIVLAYLVGKWLAQVPEPVRQMALHDFEQRIGLALACAIEAGATEIRH